MKQTSSIFWANIRQQFKYDRKKTVILVALAFVWLVLLSRHIFSTGPSLAQAETPIETSGEPQQAAEVVATTTVPPEPTPQATIFVNWSEVHKELERNPFASLWEDTAATNPDENPTPTDPVNPDNSKPVETAPSISKLEGDAYVVRSIFVPDAENDPTESKAALINMRFCYEGSRIGPYTLVEIKDRRVILKDRSGKLFYLEMKKIGRQQ